MISSNPSHRPSGGLRWTTTALVMLSLCMAANSPAFAQEADAPTGLTDLDALAWLAGTWADDSALEHWTDGEGGLMLGVHRDLRDGRASFFEFLRIALTRDGGVVYLASPAGRNPPTVFPAIVIEDNRAVFENPEHDFPQRIEYRIHEGETLVVTISMADGSKPTTWRWPRRNSN